MHHHPQQQQSIMQAAAAAYNPANITTEHIQQYLDENKALILKILESQNLGKINECAENQARLQRNLMYLAAIADCQPQPPSLHTQFLPNAVIQPGTGYLQQQQQTPQSLMASRLPMLYAQQQVYSPLQQQQQQAMHGQLGSMGPVGVGKFRVMQSDQCGVGGTMGTFHDFGRGTPGEGGLQAMNKGLGFAVRQDGDARGGSSAGQGTDKSDAYESY